MNDREPVQPEETGARKHHLYVVEDDAALQYMLAAYLEKQGLAVTRMSSAEDLMWEIGRQRPDLVVLDVGLPGMSGLEACRKLRADGDQVPIVLLTARSEAVDRILGLEMGADDYLSKPFSARELLARVRAVLRRAELALAAPRRNEAPVRIGAHTFVPGLRGLRCGDEVVMLTSIEYSLLSELVANPWVPMSREQLLAAAHGRTDKVLLRSVDTAVMRLRRRLESDPADPRYIQTARGMGYMFVPSPRLR